MPELLIELFCEEIPARMQSQAAADFARLFTEACGKQRLTVSSVTTSYGPRRLALVADVPAMSKSLVEEKRGPRADAPAKAIDSFAVANGVGRESLEARQTDKGSYLFLTIARESNEAGDVVVDALNEVLPAFPWPKSMRWGGMKMRWVRPLRRLLLLLDGNVIPYGIVRQPADPATWASSSGAGVPNARTELVADNVTEGHRFLHPAPIKVASYADYVRRLRDACVIVDAEERKRLILEGATKIAADAGLRLVEDAGLLDEVAGLVEWPVPMLGRIDAQFMDLPPEVLRTSMRVNQRYFATTQADGSPAAHFVVIANVPGSDGGAAIVAGNERVLRARFSDARFFWDQDRKQPLEAFLPKLESVTFHAKIGTQAERVERLEYLAPTIAGRIGASPAVAADAAKLAKADLATGMVGEFPELQGVMGSYYARQIYGDAVADAIRDHYAPRGPSDAIPQTLEGVAVALADKLDTLTRFIAAGERPTGSSDPLGLRRAGLGIVRMVREGRYSLPIGDIVIDSVGWLNRQNTGGTHPNQPRASQQRLDVVFVADQVTTFIYDRLFAQLRSEGRRHDILAATRTEHSNGDIVHLLTRIAALEEFLATDDGKNLLAAYKRAANILRIEEKKDSRAYEGRADPSLLTDSAETALHAALEAAIPGIDAALGSEDFAAAMAAMASLRQPLDTFFADVTVNAPETALRVNRLNLLATLRAAFDRIADFSKIEG